MGENNKPKIPWDFQILANKWLLAAVTTDVVIKKKTPVSTKRNMRRKIKNVYRGKEGWFHVGM